jgi:hypothetical protein
MRQINAEIGLDRRVSAAGQRGSDEQVADVHEKNVESEKA